MLGVFAGSTEGANGIWTERRECSMLTGKGGAAAVVVQGWYWRWGSAETEREGDCEANRELERGR